MLYVECPYCGKQEELGKDCLSKYYLAKQQEKNFYKKN